VCIDISRLRAIPRRDEEFDLRRFAGLLLPVRFRIASCRPEGLLYLKQRCYIEVGRATRQHYSPTCSYAHLRISTHTYSSKSVVHRCLVLQARPAGSAPPRHICDWACSEYYTLASKTRFPNTGTCLARPCLATYVLASYKFALTDIRPLIANICGGAFN
jgi:hypothetical protein